MTTQLPQYSAHLPGLGAIGSPSAPLRGALQSLSSSLETAFPQDLALPDGAQPGAAGSFTALLMTQLGGLTHGGSLDPGGGSESGSTLQSLPPDGKGLPLEQLISRLRGLLQGNPVAGANVSSFEGQRRPDDRIWGAGSHGPASLPGEGLSLKIAAARLPISDNGLAASPVHAGALDVDSTLAPDDDPVVLEVAALLRGRGAEQADETAQALVTELRARFDHRVSGEGDNKREAKLVAALVQGLIEPSNSSPVPSHTPPAEALARLAEFYNSGGASKAAARSESLGALRSMELASGRSSETTAVVPSRSEGLDGLRSMQLASERSTDTTGGRSQSEPLAHRDPVLIVRSSNDNGQEAASALRTALQGGLTSSEGTRPEGGEGRFNIDAVGLRPTAEQSLSRPAASPPPAPTLRMDQPMGRPEWSGELGNRIAWMTRQGVQQAELRLNPPHLGPLEVRVSVQQDGGTSVAFVAHHAQVRDALEAALPRLREMMAEQGVNLGDVDVSGQSASRQQADSTAGGARGAATQDLGGEDATESEEGTLMLRQGETSLVDYFV